MAGSCLSNSMCSFHHALLSVLWGYFENQRKLVGKESLVTNNKHASTNLGQKQTKTQSCPVDSQRQDGIGSRN